MKIEIDDNEKLIMKDIFLYLSYNFVKFNNSKIREIIRICENIDFVGGSIYDGFATLKISKKIKFNDENSNIIKLSAILLEYINLSEKVLVQEVEIILDNLKVLNIDYCTYFDDDYPELLTDIYDYPLVLYLRGNRSRLNDKNKVSIIGTRRPSYDGIKMCNEVVEHLACSDYTVVSGLAFGIDLIAHKACLKHGVSAIVVLASGVDDITPRSNLRVGMQLLESGSLIISEYPPKTIPLGINFVLRNRIISGLSMKLFVVEGGIKSGSITTAKHAISQNRRVYVMPGSISNPVSAGTNILLKEGAEIILEPNDFVYLGEVQQKLEPVGNHVYDIIKNYGEISIYNLMRISKLEYVDLMPIVSELELGRYVRLSMDKIKLA